MNGYSIWTAGFRGIKYLNEDLRVTKVVCKSVQHVQFLSVCRGSGTLILDVSLQLSKTALSEVPKKLDFGFLNKPVTLFQSILYVDMLAPTVKGQLMFLSCHFLCHRYSLDPRPNQITSTCWGEIKNDKP